MQLPRLNFPDYAFRFQKKNDKLYILDIVRKKYVRLTPEEWVRQHSLHYLIETMEYPPGLISVEYSLKINQMEKRADILCFRPANKPWLLVECKAPHVAINEKTFAQIIRYNMQLNVDYLMLTNGKKHIYCALDYRDNSYRFLRELPDYRI